MKKHTFRLEAVLKLRRLKEENCRTELGQLIRELGEINDQISHDRQEISRYYQVQEEGMKNGVRAGQAQAFPMLVAAKERNLQLLHRDKKQQEKLIEEKTRELALLRGELKLIQNLKEKDFEEHKKAYNKDMDQKIEEQTQNWISHYRREENS